MVDLQNTIPTMAALGSSTNVNVRILGAKEGLANIRALSPAARRAFLAAFEKEAWKIIKTAQQNYVPVLTGTLAFSGMVHVHPGQYPSVEFGFGGDAKKYAVVQHENTWFRHPAGGQAKYLSTPVERAQNRVIKSCGEAIRAEFRKFDTRRYE